MNTSRHHALRPQWALPLLLAALASSTAFAATRGDLDPKVRYQRETAACAAVRSPDDRANCLSEASTRFASTQPDNADESPAILQRNALRRCEVLAGDERLACVARVQGLGRVSGSVESGGIYRELVVITVGEPPAAVPAPAE